MLIVSTFHDYYDTASVYGVDKTCVYKRKTEYVVGKLVERRYGWPGSQEHRNRKTRATYFINKRVIGFCGHIFPVALVIKKIGLMDEFSGFYSLEKLKEHTAKEGFSLSDSRFLQSLPWSEFFTPNNFDSLATQFAAHNTPVFIYGQFPNLSRRDALILNPKLSDYQFYKMKEPPTAFQDIYMYLSGVLGNPNMEMPDFSDKEKAASHGHDGKYSFRKPPGKRGDPKWR